VFASAVEGILSAAPDDAVLSLRLLGELGDEHWRAVSASRLRALRPAMTVENVPVDRVRPRRRVAGPPAGAPDAPAQLSLLP
jgi:hypothetical protein